MKPTLEQIKTDESVWPIFATHYKSGIFYRKIEGRWVDCESKNFQGYSESWYEDAIPRPTKEDKDWLQINSKVMTPKGAATVNKITEDDGVFTTLGNYCRSELSPTKAFVPEVGVECEILCDYILCGANPMEVKKGQAVRVHSIVDLGFGDIALISDLEIKGTGTITFSQLSPIKSERELFVEAVKDEYKSFQWTIVDVAEALYDSGRFKLVEPTK